MNATLTANGSTSPVTLNSGEVRVQAAGTFGSGTLTLETYVGDPANEWQAVEDGAWTSGPVSKAGSLRPGSVCRLTLSGATSPSIKVSVEG